MTVRVPRWGGVFAWALLFGAVHGAVPLELSRQGKRHGWRNDGGRPGAGNLVGLVPLGAGVALLAWALANHYVTAPGKGWAIERSLEPEYLLTDGAYRLSRNPMHLGGIAIWSGWAVWFGSAPVAGGLGVLTGIYRAGIGLEEQMLERRWGDQWREYTRQTGRWLSFGPRLSCARSGGAFASDRSRGGLRS
jgi:protein-S-isoprenylcysteine O-methyltransferase Ste14